MERSMHKKIIYLLGTISLVMLVLTFILSIHDFSGNTSKDTFNMWYGIIGGVSQILMLIMIGTLDIMHPPM